MKKFWSNNCWIILLFVTWRIGLLLAGYIGIQFYNFKASFPLIDEHLITSQFSQWIWHWGNFDGVHYLDIAKNGYHGSGLQVFFPIYPLVINWLSVLINNYLLSGLLISNICFLLSLIVFYKLCCKYFNTDTAKWSVLFMIFFPTSFYFVSIYSESIFLLFLLLSFFVKYPHNIPYLILTSATRIVGVFVTFALFVDNFKKSLILFGLLGLAGYMLYLWVVFDNPIYFLSAQAAFKNERASTISSLVLPPQVIWRYLKIFTTADSMSLWVAILEFVSFICVVLILGVLTFKRKIPGHWLVFCWLSLFLPTFSGTLSSMPRYILTIFPIYIYFAYLPRLIRFVCIFTFAILQVWFTILFTRGYWLA